MGPENGPRDPPAACDRPAERIVRFPSQQFEIIRDCPRMVFCTRTASSTDKLLSIACDAARQI